jgi:hypothetical protein
MTRRYHSDAARQAAVDDFYASGDDRSVVAARHGVARSTFSAWVAGPTDDDDLAYVGGWELRGGVRYPLFPERRTA